MIILGLIADENLHIIIIKSQIGIKIDLFSNISAKWNRNSLWAYIFLY